MVYGYFAFETLCDHGYFFQSIAHGNFPRVLTVDGCARVATDDVTFAQFAVAREEVQSLDADFQTSAAETQHDVTDGIHAKVAIHHRSSTDVRPLQRRVEHGASVCKTRHARGQVARTATALALWSSSVGRKTASAAYVV